MKTSKLWLYITMLALGALGLTGCGRNEKFTVKSDIQNVEQRDYATILLVAKGDGKKDLEFSLGIAEEKKVGEKSQTEKVVTFQANDLEELYEKYWSVKGKSLSLVHLKAILIEKKEGQGMDYAWQLLEDFDESQEIAKTCPLLQITDKKAFLEYVKKAKEPVGIYLHNLIQMNDDQGRNIPWVKDYLKVMREGMNLKIYFLEKEKGGWSLKCKDEIAF